MMHQHVPNDDALGPAAAGRFAGSPIRKTECRTGSPVRAVYRMARGGCFLVGSYLILPAAVPPGPARVDQIGWTDHPAAGATSVTSPAAFRGGFLSPETST